MTHKSTWKGGERRVCRALGGDRTPLSGSNSKHTAADCIGVDLFVEIKHRAQDTIHHALTELDKKAKRYDRKPLIVYEPTNAPNYHAMWFDDYLDTHWDALVYGVFAAGGWMVEHEVGGRLPHATLVKKTQQAAYLEDRNWLVVLIKKHSPKNVALVPGVP